MKDNFNIEAESERQEDGRKMHLKLISVFLWKFLCSQQSIKHAEVNLSWFRNNKEIYLVMLQLHFHIMSQKISNMRKIFLTAISPKDLLQIGQV